MSDKGCPRYPKVKGCKCRHCAGKCLCRRNVAAWPCPGRVCVTDGAE